MRKWLDQVVIAVVEVGTKVVVEAEAWTRTPETTGEPDEPQQ